MNNETQDSVEHLQAVLATIQEQADDLINKLRFARGSKDVTQQATVAVKQVKNQQTQEEQQESLESRIRLALQRESLSIKQLVKAVGAEPSVIERTLRKLQQTKLAYNVGSAQYPVWTWRIGDSSTHADLVATLVRLISERPMTTRELIDATGARFQRVSGALVTILRGQDKDKVLNLGTQKTGRWFMIGENARPAALAPKLMARHS